MSKKEIVLLRDLVLSCLKDDVSTRNSDWRLYELVCKRLGFDSNRITVHDLAENPKGFPSYTTVTRCRRKAQEQGMFSASQKVQDFRTQQYFDFKEGMK